MKVMNADFKRGNVKFRLDQKEDAWHLFKLISQDDVVFGKAERKIKLGGEGEKGAVTKKTIWMEIKVEKTDLQGEDIRVNGIVTQEHEEIPKGSHQSISFNIGDEGTLTKGNWSMLDRQRLEQATKAKPLNVLAVVFDREEALIAQLTHNGFEIITREKGDVTRKDYGEGKENFFQSLSKKLCEMNERFKPNKIVLASPAFWKEYLLKEMPKSLQGNIILATVSSCDQTSFQELMRRPELELVFSQDRTVQEEKGLEEALSAIRADMGCYGKVELNEAVTQGNLKKVLVSEDAFTKSTVEEKIELERFLSDAEGVGAEIFILTQENSQRKLAPFKGVLGTKRWKTS